MTPMTESLTEPASDGAVKSADRALTILDVIGQRGTIRVSELVSLLGLPRSSAHGLIQTLLSRGWLEQNASSRELSLGFRAWELGQHYAGHHDLLSATKPVMANLAQQVGETVQLARLDGLENVYIAINVNIFLCVEITGGRPCRSRPQPRAFDKRGSRVQPGPCAGH